MNYLIDLELQDDLQLGEAVAGRSFGVFSSLLRRPLEHQLQPLLHLLYQQTVKQQLSH